MRILVTGDRNWKNRDVIHDELMSYAYTNLHHTLIHGACRGADTIAADIAKRFGWEVIPYPAHWKLLGLAAGGSRNQRMVDSGPGLVIAFHDDLDGKSKGTKDCVRRARAEGLPVKVVKSSGEWRFL